MKRIFLITGIGLCIYLAGCGMGGNGEELPPPPVDTIITEPPMEVLDSVDVPSWVQMLYKGMSLSDELENLECLLNVRVRMRDKDSLFNEQSRANIVGTWKLVQYFNGAGFLYGFTDCSCRSVLYIFDADSTVTVISDTTAIMSGTFKYSYAYSGVYSPMRIGEEEYDCQIADPILLFVPIYRTYGDYAARCAGGGLFFKID